MNDQKPEAEIIAEINGASQRLRSYIHNLEQRADPAGDVRRAFVAEEKAMALEVRIEELDRDIATLRNDVLSLTLQRDQALRECEGLMKELCPYRDALAEVRGESKEVQRYHWTCGDAFTDAHGEWCLYTEVKAQVDSLQLQEAASRGRGRAIMSKGCAFCRGVFSDCWQVTCDRCGKAGCSNTLLAEEGDEWECPACNQLANAIEQQEAERAEGGR